MGAFDVKGRGGELRLGYQVVATLGAWRLSGQRLDVDDSRVDAYWAEQPGALALWLQVGRRRWVWRAVTLVSLDPVAVRVEGGPEVRD